MDTGTVTLVLYLAGMGLPSWNLDYPLGGLFEAYPKMALVHTRVPVHHPLVVPMRNKEGCLYVAERERTRGNKARCQTIGVDFLRTEDSGELQLATELQITTFDGPKNKPWIIGGFPTTVPYCHTMSHRHEWKPSGRDSSICVRVPVWIMDRMDWRLIGNRLVYKWTQLNAALGG
jgi:hypothetical protein